MFTTETEQNFQKLIKHISPDSAYLLVVIKQRDPFIHTYCRQMAGIKNWWLNKYNWVCFSTD